MLIYSTPFKFHSLSFRSAFAHFIASIVCSSFSVPFSHVSRCFFSTFLVGFLFHSTLSHFMLLLLNAFSFMSLPLSLYRTRASQTTRSSTAAKRPQLPAMWPRPTRRPHHYVRLPRPPQLSGVWASRRSTRRWSA